MTHFRFEALDAKGLRRSGRVEAATRPEAMALAAAGGARVTRLEPVSSRTSLWTRDFGGGASRAHLLPILKDLSLLLGAGLTIDRSLRLVIRQAPDPVKPHLEAILADVLSGLALSRALARHPQLFPRDVIEVTAAGELTGTLSRVLSDLALSRARAEEIRRTVVSALIYPALLLTMALGIVGLVLAVLVPSLEPLFDQPDVAPPAIIALTRSLRGLLADRWPILLAGLLGAVGALAFAWRRPGFARAREDALFRAPLLGPVLVGIEMGRLCRILGTLLGAQVPLPAAIDAARQVPKSRAVRHAVSEAARRIPEGARLAAALSDLEPLSPMTLQMIATGEEVNRVPDMLMRAAELHEETVRTRIDRLFTVMTPLITALMGLVVGGLILSIMSAIFSVNDLATQ
ncbi:type II secretion system F family protein [Aureimonas pseudogalii]|uniref:Type II secretory pathway component PulF n=1 Tax=Aureimonas pseudogalii TaxID=1744844 RepID=A0A7W6EF02_9HYPH|nr:type II secretion system F family protein [Aureimonas pseudogalii]MBB3997048.1 type II secretory pathway component PulF [Aureimonas pseudogalii]